MAYNSISIKPYIKPLGHQEGLSTRFNSQLLDTESLLQKRKIGGKRGPQFESFRHVSMLAPTR